VCIICLEFEKWNDLKDARRMIEAARREVAIDESHLQEIEKKLAEEEKKPSSKTSSKTSSNP